MNQSTDTVEPCATLAGKQGLLAGKKVLFVVSELPTRGTAGYHTYNRSILHALLALDANVDLLVLSTRYKKLHDTLGDLPGRHRLVIEASGVWRWRDRLTMIHPLALAGLVKRWLRTRCAGAVATPAGTIAKIGRFITPRQIQRVLRHATERAPDLLLLDTLFLSPLAARTTIPAAIVAHDVFHQRTASLRQMGLHPEPPITQAEEARHLQKADAVIAISLTDQREISTLYPTGSLFTFAPRIDTMALPAGRRIGKKLFYMGSAAHHNLQGMRWFLKAVWPWVREAVPGIELVIAGDIGPAVSGDVGAGILILGRVDNPAEAAEECAVAIDPVQAGSGVKIKILSYLAMGLPCVTTSAGAQGLEAYMGRLRVTDEAEQFVQAIHDIVQGGSSADARPLHATEAPGQDQTASFGDFLLSLMRPKPPAAAPFHPL